MNLGAFAACVVAQNTQRCPRDDLWLFVVPLSASNSAVANDDDDAAAAASHEDTLGLR